jgi:hypothetical protein|tara:strand:- start:5473 stop:5748 length:276 start_codon:yes stop_codon:yes gene_type:complete
MSGLGKKLLTCSKLGKIDPKDHLTGYDGSDKWKKIHATVNSIECEFCRQKGIKLMRGIHDAVSIHIGKKPVYPNDLKFTHNYVTRAVQNAR